MNGRFARLIFNPSYLEFVNFRKSRTTSLPQFYISVREPAGHLASTPTQDRWPMSSIANRALLQATAFQVRPFHCLLYTSDAADDLLCVDLGGRRIIKK